MGIAKDFPIFVRGRHRNARSVCLWQTQHQWVPDHPPNCRDHKGVKFHCLHTLSPIFFVAFNHSKISQNFKRSGAILRQSSDGDGIGQAYDTLKKFLKMTAGGINRFEQTIT